jgi:cysteine synthase A
MGLVLVKLEYYNPTGSYKDRMALAMVCAIKGYRFAPISSDGFSDEKLRTMRLFGGDLEIFRRKAASWYQSSTRR